MVKVSLTFVMYVINTIILNFQQKNEYQICFKKSNHIFMYKIKCTAKNWKRKYREQQCRNDVIVGDRVGVSLKALSKAALLNIRKH